MPRLLLLLLRLRSVEDVFKYAGYAFFAVLFLLAASVAALSDVLGDNPEPPSANMVDAGSIPAEYKAAYQAAGARYGIDWEVIAGIGFVETRHGTYTGGRQMLNGCILGPDTPYGQAKGPMQFLDSSWELFGEDGNGDGLANACDIRDAPFGAARHLQSAPGTRPIDYEAAVYAYNHSEAYVAEVLGAAYWYGWRSGDAANDATGDSWYRYQGDSTSGSQAGTNCGPASVAMGIKRATGQHVAIAALRNGIGHGGYTSTSDLTWTLGQWGIPYRYNPGGFVPARDIGPALGRGSVVIALVRIDYMSLGSDVDTPYSSPGANRSRYVSSSFDHWFVIKGKTADGRYYRVNDPLAFDGSGKYFYSGNAVKGRDRFFKVDEVHAAMHAWSYPQAIELPGAWSSIR